MSLVEELTELSISRSSMNTGLSKNIRLMDPVDNYNKIWRGNLAYNIIEKEKSVNITFQTSSICEKSFLERIPIHEILDQQSLDKMEHWLEKKENSSEILAVRCSYCVLNKKEKENNCTAEIKKAKDIVDHGTQINKHNRGSCTKNRTDKQPKFGKGD
ncbi:40029_t:CDS:2 [Gigaspora margarita]|uniref:40029_t:CDS:1 n=1 Tax=Gigaspora margarita TaxID=4874 RepID=A0ABN7VBC6_GIGMA|nr:40029_t:CDS:2 [Gigaspora margarita]